MSGSLWRTLTLLLLGSQVFRCGGKEECSGSQGGSADLYVSFVMVGRADDLRGDYVSRLANSIQLIQKYSLLHHVESEIVVVEWNPFQGQPALSAVLRQFVPTSPAPPAPPIRIITVPNSFHRKVQGDTNQTFFEFMAKNVGARRARGEFVLVSNGDVVFNQHVFRALSKKLLDRDAYFRIPRVETSAVFDPREDVMRRIELVESMSTSLTEEPLCDVGQTFCPGRYNVGVCERGFLGSERHDIHFGNADELYMPAAGDFFLIHRSNFHLLGGYHSIPSTTHLDSLLLCKASGAGLRQIVLTRPCVMFHQKHPVKDLDGIEVSDACVDDKMDNKDCRRRFLLPGWELTEERCAEIEQEARSKLAERNLEAEGGGGGGGGGDFLALPSLDENWGFPAEEFAEVTL